MKVKFNLFFLFFSLLFYGQNDTISVVKNSTISVVSVDKLNVVYRGLLNPISIAVSNCKSFTVTGNGLNKNNDGTYQLVPGAGLETTITIEIVLHDNSIKIEEHKFRIKNISRYSGAINGLSCEQCIIEMSKTELKSAIISVDFKLQIYGIEIKDEVDYFNVEFSNENNIINFGNSFNKETLDKINSLKLGSTFVINDIHWPNPNQICRSSPRKIKVMIVDDNLENED